MFFGPSTTPTARSCACSLTTPGSRTRTSPRRRDRAVHVPGEGARAARRGRGPRLPRRRRPQGPRPRPPGDGRDPAAAARPGAMAQVTADLSRRPEVLEVYFLAGANDFLVHVATDSTDALRRFVGDQLNRNPAIAGTETNLIFEHVRRRACRPEPRRGHPVRAPRRTTERVAVPGGHGDLRGRRDARRRRVVAATAVAGVGVLGASLVATPGSPASTASPRATALTFAGGGLASGPFPAGGRRAPTGLRRPVVGPVLTGVGAFGAFYAAALVAKRFPVLTGPSRRCALRRQGVGGLVYATTLANGAAEEVFFRGALDAGRAAMRCRRPPGPTCSPPPPPATPRWCSRRARWACCSRCSGGRPAGCRRRCSPT